MTPKNPKQEKEKLQKKVEAEVAKVEKEIKAEAKKEVKVVKVETEKKIKDLKCKNEELMELLLSALSRQEKEKSEKNMALIVSVCSLILSVFCWALCFYLMSK